MGAFLAPARRPSQIDLRKGAMRMQRMAEITRSFFGNLLRLYSFLLAQAGYGDKWPS
jgi:hypothetical protein